MSVGRICQRHVDLAEPEETVRMAAERMRQRSVGTLVVLDEERRPAGIVTDRDLVLRVIAAGLDPEETLVKDVMTEAPRTVTDETPIEDTVALMRSGAFRRVPVVDVEGQLAGLVSVDDVLALLAEEFTSIGELLRKESPGSGEAV
jgi:CBS domain-containing protein